MLDGLYLHTPGICIPRVFAADKSVTTAFPYFLLWRIMMYNNIVMEWNITSPCTDGALTAFSPEWYILI